MSENEPAQDDAVSEDQRSEAPNADVNNHTETVEEESDDLIERIEDSDAEEIANEIETLREEIDELQATIDDLESGLKRKQADFQNYKKRMQKRREQEQKRATEDLITRIIDVRDNLKRGLEQDGEIRDGIETTLRQFDQILDQENVAEIDPDPGDAVDPQRHEVLMRVESDQPENTIDAVHRSGYEMADKIIREAQVTVSDEESTDN